MKKIILLIFFIPLINFSQSKKFKKDFRKNLKSQSFLFLTDWQESSLDGIILNKNVLPEILSNAEKFGYEFLREEDQMIFEEGIFNFFIIKKDVRYAFGEFLPDYPVGEILKKIYFTKKPIEKAIIVKIETEIRLIEYSNVSKSNIMKYFDFVKNFIKRSYLESYNLGKSEQKYNNKSMLGTYYNLVKINKIWKINELTNHKSEMVLSFGNGSLNVDTGREGISKKYIFMFSIEHQLFSYETNSFIKEKEKQTNESFNNLKFIIGGEDIRKSNIYNLKSMVNIFLEDCKKNNITTPSITTLKATFEPLDENIIALSSGFNNDSEIIVKVDPNEWEKSSKEKRWYILYHELGHDVLNLDHGEGGKMMFNFANKEYSWNEFFEDKKNMFNIYKKKYND